MSINDFSVYQHAITESKRRTAEWEGASARMELAKINERCAELMSQHNPVAAFGMDREQLRHILGYIRHGDIKRLYREAGVEPK